MTYAPPEELPEILKQAPCHCVQRHLAFGHPGIFRILSELDFEPASAYSLCAAFVTCICLFVERSAKPRQIVRGEIVVIDVDRRRIDPVEPGTP
jgi:hypothetical protein